MQSPRTIPPASSVRQPTSTSRAAARGGSHAQRGSALSAATSSASTSSGSPGPLDAEAGAEARTVTAVVMAVMAPAGEWGRPVTSVVTRSANPPNRSG